MLNQLEAAGGTPFSSTDNSQRAEPSGAGPPMVAKLTMTERDS